ncbi:hypothetical protein HPB49_004986 [Dermacentor silvarum]|uniref:Uncharacterized protein n=1 Tax=Dermacentor silvarum TaxID=543639 RepID=A0ACB8CVB3_DERSI|nr:hypothetical protein HPB49_004986 [Dermacentor silvarum]
MALELWYTNCRSVKNKLVDLQSTIAALPANTLILLTKTWLDPGVLDGELMDISSHTIFRRDRRGRGCHKAGLILFVTDGDVGELDISESEDNSDVPMELQPVLVASD